MANVAGSFASPSADAVATPRVFNNGGIVTSILEGVTFWKAFLTLFLAAVIYDQCEFAQANVPMVL